MTSRNPIKITLLPDASEFDVALKEYRQLCKSVDAPLELFSNLSELCAINVNELAAARAGELRVIFKPSKLLLNAITTLRARN